MKVDHDQFSCPLNFPRLYGRGFKFGALKTSVREQELAAHTHEYNEILGWLGTDWNNPRDLGGEIEFWLEDEKYILKHSCIIFVPKGMKHCPLKDLRIDRPFIHFGVMTEGDYSPAG